MTAAWPTDAIAGTEHPLVLLPVRIETRYARDPLALRVRVYPDDIHVDRLDDVLSFAEQSAGNDYWASLWTGEADETAAFVQLGRRVGQRRAAWVAHASTPDNLEQRPDPPAAQPAPEAPLVLTGDPRVAPLARGLPERFVAVALTKSGELLSVAVGERVPDPLPLDVAALAPETVPATDDGGLRTAHDAKWTIDYKAACDVGMGITLPLRDVDPALLREHLRVIVLGVRPGDGAFTLEQLLRAHRFTSDLDVLPPGAPTNNTETDRTAWSSAAPPRQPRTRIVPAADAAADGPRLGTALGIGRFVLDDAPGAAGRAWSLGIDARTALWPASWGAFFDTTLDVETAGATLSDAMRDQIRDHYEGRVSGGGPFRALRVGRQPYGILPVLGAASPDALSAPLPGGLAAIAATIDRIRGLVAGVRGPQATQQFLEVLRTAPAALGLRFRIGLPNLEELLAPIITDPFGAGPPPPPVPQEIVERDSIAKLFGLSFGRLGNVVFEPKSFPLLLPLVHDSDPDFVARLRAGGERTIVSVLQALLELGRDREHRQIKVGTGSVDVPVELVALLREHLTSPQHAGGESAFALADRLATLPDLVGDPVALRDIADALHRERGGDQAGPSMLAELQPLHIPRWFSSLANCAEREPDPLHQLALRYAAVEAWCRATSRALRFDVAMGRVAAADVEQRRIALAEALDTASHRLDAWVTSLADHHLAAVRDGGHPGALLGAYGWVDELPPINSAGQRAPAAGGFIHAPSIAQATAAGVLRSANLANGEAFAVDLTSERVRTALDLLGGVRQGQTLGAVVGYRIERALHEADAALERFVLTLRALAPAATGVITAANGPGAVSTVLDGVALLRLDRERIRKALVEGVGPENPFGAPTAATADEVKAVFAVLDDATQTYDAVADLVLADSVHALAGGATARAASVLDGAAGEAPAPEPEFHRTPTQGLPVTHRDLLVLGAPAAPSAWPSITPRAQAEPLLEAWAAARLGAPPEAAVAAGLSALDVVYTSAAQPPPLALPAATLAVARALRQLVTGARPLEPSGLCRSGDDPVRTVDLGDLERRMRAVLIRLQDVPQATDADALRTLAAYGVDVSGGIEPARAEGVRRAEAAAVAAASTPPDWTAAASALFGPEFRLLPQLIAPETGDPSLAHISDAQPRPSEIRRFLRDVATVRAPVARHAATLLLADAFGLAPTLRVIQLDTTDTRWVALPFDSAHPAPTRPVTSLVVETVGELDAQRVAGLVLDEWVEIVPTRTTLTSGVAVHADAPNARPPQAVLVAVRPDAGDWTVELLARTVSSTLDLAMMRAVTLEHSAWLGHVLPALLMPMFSLSDEPVLDFNVLSSAGNPPPIPFVKDA